MHTPEWYKRSGIIECSTCDGKGGEMRHRYAHANDPDNWLVECPDCDGVGHHACEVCGNDVPVKGFDCLVCDLALEAASHPEFEPATLTACIEAAFAAARAERDAPAMQVAA